MTIKNASKDIVGRRGYLLRTKHLVLAAGTVVFLTNSTANARDLFRMDLNVDGFVESQPFSDFEALIDNIDSDRYATINNRYTQTSIARSDIDLRGLPLVLEYPTAGTALNFVVPDLGINRTFQGATREESEDMLIDFLKSNQDDLLTEILRKLAEKTPIDPVAGNPNSLMSKMIDADFSMGNSVGPMPSNSARSGSDDEDRKAPNLIGLNARFGSFAAEDYDTTVYDLPLAYVIPLADPRYAVNLDLPITYIDTEGAASFSASIGAGMRFPILDNWTITPAVRAGATGSLDLGSAGVVYSASVTSSFRHEIGGFTLALGNMGAFVQTLPLSYKIDNFEIDYDLTNFVARNGLSLSKDIGVDFFGKSLTMEASAVNTQFFGDNLFIENYTDLALSVGTEASQNRLTWDSMRLGLTYTFSDKDYSGFRLNFGYQF